MKFVEKNSKDTIQKNQGRIFDMREIKHAEKFEDIDLDYVNPRKEGGMFMKCLPYLKVLVPGVFELADNTPDEIKELVPEMLKYCIARDDYTRITGEELH